MACRQQRRISDDTESRHKCRPSFACLEKDTIALAAGTVTVALAANAAAMGSSTSPEKVSPCRIYSSSQASLTETSRPLCGRVGDSLRNPSLSAVGEESSF